MPSKNIDAQTALGAARDAKEEARLRLNATLEKDPVEVARAALRKAELDEKEAAARVAETQREANEAALKKFRAKLSSWEPVRADLEKLEGEEQTIHARYAAELAEVRGRKTACIAKHNAKHDEACQHAKALGVPVGVKRIPETFAAAVALDMNFRDQTPKDQPREEHHRCWRFAQELAPLCGESYFFSEFESAGGGRTLLEIPFAERRDALMNGQFDQIRELYKVAVSAQGQREQANIEAYKRKRRIQQLATTDEPERGQLARAWGISLAELPSPSPSAEP
jgi:hypothetical protein